MFKHPSVNLSISAEQVVAAVMEAYPQTVPVFLRYRMSCVGCSLSNFETVREASAIYKLDLDSFLAELRQAAGEGRQNP